MAPTIWFPAICAVAGGLAVAIVGALATIRSARIAANNAAEQALLTANANAATAQSHVQVARIEADTASENHAWEWLEQERKTGSEAAAALRLCEKERNTAQAEIIVLEAKVERLEQDKSYLLGLIAKAGLESYLSRVMVEEMELAGGNVTTIETILPELRPNPNET